jgi:hypothetical protein
LLLLVLRNADISGLPMTNAHLAKGLAREVSYAFPARQGGRSALPDNFSTECGRRIAPKESTDCPAGAIARAMERPAARLLRMPRSCPCRRRHTVGRTDRLGIDQASAPITWRFWQRRRRNQFATETGASVAELVEPQHSRAVTCVVVRYGISVGGAADSAISDPRGLTYMAKCRDARCI